MCIYFQFKWWTLLHRHYAILSTGMAPSDMTVAQKKQLVVKESNYQLIAGNLYKLGAHGILRRCVLEHERTMILLEAHEGIA
jgi:hypothetical protein